MIRRLAMFTGVLLLSCAACASSKSTSNEPSSVPAVGEPKPTSEPTSVVAPVAAPSASAADLAVGSKVLVGAGFIFNEGTVESLTCAGDGSVAEGYPCVLVKVGSQPADTSRAIIHPIADQVVAPKAGDVFICGKREGEATTWSPCRALERDGSVVCEILEAPAQDCAELTLVRASESTRAGISDAFSQ